ncbi:family 43 glycosylhydrolase [Echinicola sp. CAU 1574]|uniref:Family 43 glycosylhydrolase n=1 Tax=Echinicola arenosa TaxID=2774144 RepID=A0ABR9AHH1_9BACT|nr:glycoside hydrolase family 43 protein [Echinicola arenosa]MBD8488176.1 family 43 glycosylhydrolase [Echinicola arenosa]
MSNYKCLLFLFCLALNVLPSQVQGQRRVRDNIPLDSIRLSDPCILADQKTEMYYMTGTGGWLWKSKDLKNWSGPYRVVETDPDSWMGERPAIWAAELHHYQGKYYNFATFTNNDIIIDTVAETKVPRRASHVLVSDQADGPYKPIGNEDYLPENWATLDGTFWVDKDGKPYMVFCHEWLQTGDGTMEKILLKDDLSGTVGESKLLFLASDSPWSRGRKDGKVVPNVVTDGPYLFSTETERLGMIWTSWVFDEYTQGVAYSKSGTLDGPWIQEEKPITPPNFGHGMLFQTFDGKWLMAAHSHRDENGRYIRIPHLFEVDLSGDQLVIVQPYVP